MYFNNIVFTYVVICALSAADLLRARYDISLLQLSVFAELMWNTEVRRGVMAVFVGPFGQQPLFSSRGQQRSGSAPVASPFHHGSLGTQAGILGQTHLDARLVWRELRRLVLYRWIL